MGNGNGTAAKKEDESNNNKGDASAQSNPTTTPTNAAQMDARSAKSGKGGETKGRDETRPGEQGTEGMSEGDAVQKLICTVEDAKSNTFVPFISSVKDTGQDTSGNGNSEEGENEEGETTESSSDSDESTKFIFGEVAIDLKANIMQGGSLHGSSSPNPSKGKSPGLYNDRNSGVVLAAHHSGMSHDPWKGVEVGKLSPEGKGMRMGDLRLVADPRSISVASWFSASTRFAIPRRYSFIPFAAQHGPIRCLSASAEANQVAIVVSGGKQCYVMDLQGNLLMSVKGHLDPVLSCSQSKDGKFLVTTSADCTAVMWDLNNGKKLRELPVSTQVNCVTVSDESDAIATTSTDDVVHLWDSKSCDPLIMFQRHTAGIFSMSFSRRGGMVASGSSNGEIYVWAQQSGEVRNFLAKHRTPVLGVSFSHDSQRLVSVDRESLRVWDLFTGQCIFCRDTKGNLLYGVDEEHGATKAQNEENVRYTCCAFVAGQLIATGLTSKQLLLIDPNEGKEVLSLSTKNLVTSLSPSWMGDVLFVGDLSGNIYRLEMTFSQSDVLAFHLDSKPPTKEKRMEKD